MNILYRLMSFFIATGNATFNINSKISLKIKKNHTNTLFTQDRISSLSSLKIHSSRLECWSSEIKAPSSFTHISA